MKIVQNCLWLMEVTQRLNLLFYYTTGLPTKNETKDDTKLKNMTIWSLIFGFCIQLSILMIFKMIKHRNKVVLAEKERLDCKKMD